jgi:predicted small secreted protein
MKRILVIASFVMLATVTAGLAADTVPGTGASGGATVALYLHGNARSEMCLGVEKSAHAVIHEAFAPALEQGALSWRTLNFEDHQNVPLLANLTIPGSCLLLVHTAPDGTFTDARNLQKIWFYSRNEQRLREYIVDEVTTYLQQ